MAVPGFSETTALVAVLEEKSFRNEARKLGVSPARVSELVRNLEAMSGCVWSSARRDRSLQARPGSAWWSGSARRSTIIEQRLNR